MELLFLSYIYIDNSVNNYVQTTKSGLDYAADTFCRSIIKGLEENHVSWNAINVPHVGSYPVFNKCIRVKPEKSCDGKIESVGYCNLIYYKRYSIRKNVYKQILKWNSDCGNEKEKVILIYNFDMLPILDNIKKVCNGVKIVMIVTDLLDYMPVNNAFLRSINRYDKTNGQSYLEKKCSAVDGFILLAPAMYEKLPIHNKPWVLMEGIYSDNL